MERGLQKWGLSSNKKEESKNIQLTKKLSDDISFFFLRVFPPFFFKKFKKVAASSRKYL